MQERILTNKNIVLTHPSSENSEQFCKYFRDAGANVYHFPMVNILPIDFSKSIFSDITEYNSIIFTSRNGVKFLLQDKEILKNIINSRIDVICIGKQTEKTLNDFGITVNLIPKTFNSNNLLYVLKQKTNNKILLIQGYLAPNKLEKYLSKTNNVKRVNVYNTIINKNRNESLYNLCLTKSVDYYIFTSPSCFEGLVKFNNNCISKASKIVSIGPTTSKKIKELGYSVYLTAEESTYYGIYKSILKEL